MVSTHAVRHSIEEYVRMEEYANVKHEYLDGRIYLMAGGTPEHAALAAAVMAQLAPQLRGRRCRVYSSDLRVRVVATGLATYPDVTIVCGEEKHDAQDRHALNNPIVLVEVLSPTTAEYDRGEKLEHYQQIPTLQEVVFVAHDRPGVEIVRRDASGAWTRHPAGPGETAQLPSIECSLDVDELFRDPLAPP